MPGRHDATGVEPSAGPDAFPAGVYHLEIIEAVEEVIKSGDNAGRPKVTVAFRVIGGPHAGRHVKFYTVCFLPKEAKGAGMVLHFLKTIGEPYEGQFNYDEDRWIGKIIKAYVTVEEDRQNRRWNKVGQVMVPDVEFVKTLAADNGKQDDIDIPF